LTRKEKRERKRAYLNRIECESQSARLAAMSDEEKLAQVVAALRIAQPYWNPDEEYPDAGPIASFG